MVLTHLLHKANVCVYCTSQGRHNTVPIPITRSYLQCHYKGIIAPGHARRKFHCNKEPESMVLAHLLDTLG